MEGLDSYFYLTPDDARAENQQFIEKLSSEASRKKKERQFTKYARTKVRKESFVRSILKSKEIDRCELNKIKRLVSTYESKHFKCTLAGGSLGSHLDL